MNKDRRLGIFLEIIEATPNGTMTLSKTYQILFISSNVAKFWELNPELCVGKNIGQFLPELKELKAFDKKKKWAYNMVINGKYYCIVPLDKGDERKEERQYLVFDLNQIEKLTLRWLYNNGLALELEEMFEGSFDGMAATDAKGKILYVNHAYEQITGVTKKEMAGKSMADLQNPIWDANAIIDAVQRQQKVITMKQTVKSGKHILVTARPVFYEGKIKLIVINARDITEIYQLSEQFIRTQQREDSLEKVMQAEELKYAAESASLLAVSKSMRDVVELARRIANLQVTVLIEGESGVGKDEVTKFIHENSLRKDKPLITVNCGAIPPGLLESELFGYEKGAFTGAMSTGKAGLLEMADGGTLFLDEIGETPLDFQVKLLRFLETKENRRVGSVRSKEVDVRIIAATNRRLSEMVDNGTFREDLYYRLNVVNLKIPPLRKRREDIIPLALLFLSRYNKKYDRHKKLTVEVTKELRGYPWFGNVRQLKNTIENMVVLSINEYLQPEDLPWFSGDEVPPSVKNITQRLAEDGTMPLQAAIEYLERSLLENAMKRCKTTTEIGSLLGINQSTVVRKIKKYGLRISS